MEVYLPAFLGNNDRPTEQPTDRTTDRRTDGLIGSYISIFLELKPRTDRKRKGSQGIANWWKKDSKSINSIIYPFAASGCRIRLLSFCNTWREKILQGIIPTMNINLCSSTGFVLVLKQFFPDHPVQCTYKHIIDIHTDVWTDQVICTHRRTEGGGRSFAPPPPFWDILLTHLLRVSNLPLNQAYFGRPYYLQNLSF